MTSVIKSYRTISERDLIMSNNRLKSQVTEMRYHCEVYKLSLRCINKILKQLQQSQTTDAGALKHSVRANYQSAAVLLSQKQALEKINSVLTKAKTFINGYSLLDETLVPVVEKVTTLASASVIPKNPTVQDASCISKVSNPDCTSKVEKQPCEKIFTIEQRKPTALDDDKKVGCEITSGNDFKRVGSLSENSSTLVVEEDLKTHTKDHKNFSKNDLMKNRSSSEKQKNKIKANGRCKSTFKSKEEEKKNRESHLEKRRNNGGREPIYSKKDFFTGIRKVGLSLSKMSTREVHPVRNHNFIESTNIKFYRNNKSNNSSSTTTTTRYPEIENFGNAFSSSPNFVQKIDTVQTRRRVLYSTHHHVIKKYNRYNNNQNNENNNRARFLGSNNSSQGFTRSHNNSSTNFTAATNSQNSRQRKYFRHDNPAMVNMQNQGKVRRVDVYPENVRRNEWDEITATNYQRNKLQGFKANMNKMQHNTTVISTPSTDSMNFETEALNNNKVLETVTTRLIPQTRVSPVYLEDPRLKNRKVTP